MRIFYFVKLLQAVLAIFVLWKIVSTSELCSTTISTNVLRQRLTNELCNMSTSVYMPNTSANVSNVFMNSERIPSGADESGRLVQFFTGVLKVWDSIVGYDPRASLHENKAAKVKRIENMKRFGNGIDASMDEDNADSSVQSEDMETNGQADKKYKQCIELIVFDFFGGMKLKPAPRALRLFAVPIYCLLGFLAITFLHAILQGKAKYNTCALLSVFMCGTCWLFVLMAMLTIDYNWDTLWASADTFKPEIMDAVSCAKYVALGMISIIFVEGLFSKWLTSNVVFSKAKKAYFVNEPDSKADVEECLLPPTTDSMGFNVERKYNQNALFFRPNMQLSYSLQ